MKNALEKDIRSRFDSGLYYQTVDILITAEQNEYDVKLDEHFEYCDGFRFSGMMASIKEVAIKDKGEFILNKVPGGFLEMQLIKKRRDMFIPINMIASGTTKKIQIKVIPALVGVKIPIVFRLTTEKPKYKNKKFEYKTISIPTTGIEYEVYLSSKVKKITGVCAIPNGGNLAGVTITLKDEIRTYLKNMKGSEISADIHELFRDRIFPIQIRKNKITANFKEITIAKNIFLIFEYEE